MWLVAVLMISSKRLEINFLNGVPLTTSRTHKALPSFTTPRFNTLKDATD
jgi:hypothetical protein